jgi:hypothetical protein
MCDYSLHFVASRPAKVGDKLVTTKFANSLTRGFSAVGEPNIAVCLRPGTEIAFETDVEYNRAFIFLPKILLKENVARFRFVDLGLPETHHDALEFPNGQIVLLTRLCEGQHATVLQLPAIASTATETVNRNHESLVA